MAAGPIDGIWTAAHEPVIPAVAHFIWFGSTFPWVNELALTSAVERGGFEQVVLHHDGALSIAERARIAEATGASLRPIDPPELFRTAGVAGLDRVYAGLGRPNARANVVRAALLAIEGGVYLDMDTVTLRSFRPLLEDRAFVGEEHVAWPAVVKRSRRLDVQAKALLRDAARAVCAGLPHGWRVFRRIAGWYPTAVNNAVFGAEARHPFLTRLLRAMVEVPEDRRRVSYALGTHLLQTELAAWGPGSEAPVRIHPPPVFYPLGPVLSRRWFAKESSQVLSEVLSPDTRLVHWYASVRTRHIVPRIDPDYVRAHAERQLFSALARPFLGPDSGVGAHT